MKRIAYVVFLALILSSCSVIPMPVETPTPDNCSSEDLAEFITEMDDLSQRFEDLVHVAEDTPAENLLLVIKEMESLRQGVDNIDTPPCALRTKAAFGNYAFSKIQCISHIYAIEGLKITPQFDHKIDRCSLASDQLEYYNTEMGELRILLLEKN